MAFQVDTKLYIWFLVVLSLYIIVISSFNIYYYGKIRSQYSAQPDVIQDVGKGWANAMWGLNIALLVISSLIFVVQLYKGISGKVHLGLWDWIKKKFNKKETVEDIAKQFKVTDDCINSGVSAWKNTTGDEKTKTLASKEAMTKCGISEEKATAIATFWLQNPGIFDTPSS
jgi:hypothetical protein